MWVIGISKSVFILCFVNITIVFSNPASWDSNNLPNVVCCTECTCNVTESGKCSLNFQQECSDGTCILFDFKNETSVIELVVSVEENITSLSTKSAQETGTDIEIKLDISEFDNKMNEYVLLEKRRMLVNDTQLPMETYTTRTSKARICVSSTTEWSNYSMELSFKEFEYRREIQVEDPFNMSGEILGKYQPNSDRLWQIPKDPNRKWRGIEITIQDLEIDTERGEYLLIGAGSPNDYDFRPRFVTQITNNSSFYVANASAYIEFVSRPTVKTDEPFKILWNRKDAEIPSTINPADLLNSVLICFNNYSQTQEEFEGKNIDEVFPQFREKFAERAKKYLKSNNKKEEAGCLDKSSVKIIGYSKTSNALSVLIMLVCEERVFRYKVLKNIADDFENYVEYHELGYKVSRCPDVQHDLPYDGNWSILIYALVPAFAFFILIAWAWKNNVFSQSKCTTEKEEVMTFGLESNSVPVEPNMYERTIPKVLLVDGEGRRQTLVPGSSQEDTERREPESETVVEMDAIPSTSRESDSLTRVLTNRKGKRRPSIQALIPKNKENENNDKSDIQKTEGEESEHLYDSVSSSKQMNETKL